MQKNLKVIQGGYKDCASACLLSIIRYYKGNISKEELSYLINTSSKGTSAYFMIEGVKKIGFDGYGIKLTCDEIFKDDILLPCIVHVKSNNYYHFIVIYKILSKSNKIKVMDPAYGFITLSKKEFNDIYLGNTLIFYPVKPVVNNNEKINSFEFIKDYCLSSKKTIIQLIILSILTVIFTMIYSLYLKIIIDYLIKFKDIKYLYFTTIIFVIVILLKNIFTFIRNKILINFKFYLSKNLTLNIVKHILYLPYRYVKSKPVGEITSRLEETESVKDLICDCVLSLFIDLMIIVISIFLLMFINIKLFLIILMVLLLYTLISCLINTTYNKKIYDSMNANAEYNSYLIESINNYSSIKNLSITNNVYRKLEVKYIALLNKIRALETLFNRSSNIKDIILDIGLVLSLAFGSYLIIKSKLTIGDLVAFNTLAIYFIEPIKSIINKYPDFKHSSLSLERIKDFTGVKEEPVNNLNKKCVSGDIVVNNLSYSYNNIDYIFNNINISIKKNSSFLIYGKSGGGKSTFIKVLLKYLDNYSGDIFIGDKNLKDIKHEVVQNSLTYVSQDENLFNDTLINNITSLRKVSEEDYEEILRITKVNEIRNKKKFRDLFLIEENGFNLSGGERQKIVLARSLLKRSNILVLDEALSEVGIDEEKEILNNIKASFRSTTLIYISHKEEIKSIFENKYKLC
ncbi:MAG: ABC transporter transmembrane domain-containing protein [Bacilli bacterium]